MAGAQSDKHWATNLTGVWLNLAGGASEQARRIGFDDLASSRAGNHQIITFSTLGTHQMLGIKMVSLGEMATIRTVYLLRNTNHFCDSGYFFNRGI
jgi:hypothetical protein